MFATGKTRGYTGIIRVTRPSERWRNSLVQRCENFLDLTAVVHLFDEGGLDDAYVYETTSREGIEIGSAKGTCVTFA